MLSFKTQKYILAVYAAKKAIKTELPLGIPFNILAYKSIYVNKRFQIFVIFCVENYKW